MPFGARAELHALSSLQRLGPDDISLVRLGWEGFRSEAAEDSSRAFCKRIERLARSSRFRSASSLNCPAIEENLRTRIADSINAGKFPVDP